MDPIVIIGTGIAGYTLAREFRKLDKHAPLLIITADDGRSYPKPMLSNALTKGKSADQLAMFDADTMANTLAAEIITNSVVSQIDPQQKKITIFGREALKYDKLVLAVGAEPIITRNENNTIKINSLDDYVLCRDQLIGAGHVALIGPGLIGCEFANDLTNVGIKVSVIGPDPHPMSNLLPAPIGKELREVLAQAGVDWYLGTTVSDVNQGEDSAYELKLQDGGVVINADVVVSAIGLKPNIELAQKIGLVTARGIVTDDKLQTSQESIYALGDCAEVAGHSLLFIAPIMAAAKALAKTLVGQPTAVIYPAMPIAIKTPSYPLVVASPSREAIGEWQFEASPSGFGIKALFVGAADDTLLGFVLSGDAVSEKQALTKQLPGLLN